MGCYSDQNLTTSHEQKQTCRTAVLGATQLLTALIYLLFKSGLHAQVDTHQQSVR